jgi:hypothetical protein
MKKLVEFLTKLGFEESICDPFPAVRFEEDDLEWYSDRFEKNISLMRGKFDDEFIVEAFVIYTTAFMVSDFEEKLRQIEIELDADLWAKLIQHEWYMTGESSVFALMDNLMIGYFENHISEVCDHVRSVWENDEYDDDGDDDDDDDDDDDGDGCSFGTPNSPTNPNL